jgi:O-methyltransferase
MTERTSSLHYSVLNLRTRAFAKNTLAKLGLRIQRLPGGKPNPIHLWEEDERFNEIMKQVVGYTLVDKTRCFMLYQLAKQAANVPGDVAEVGVYKGGTARLLAQTFAPTGKTIHLFDTFSGMPLVDMHKDMHQQADFNDTSCESVGNYLRQFSSIRLYPGVFPDTSKPVKNARFCFVHIDVDIYQSVRDCCDFFYPSRMERGGFLVFDDYGFVGCPGAKAAVDEFFANTPERPCYLPTGQCVVIKL